MPDYTGIGLPLFQAPTKTVTFDGSAGNGAVGTVAIWTVTGRIYIEANPIVTCLADLVHPGGDVTIRLGTTSVVALFGPLFTVDNGHPITAGSTWVNGSLNGHPSTGFLLSESIIMTIGGFALTGGTFQFDCMWSPITTDGSLS